MELHAPAGLTHEATVLVAPRDRKTIYAVQTYFAVGFQDVGDMVETSIHHRICLMNRTRGGKGCQGVE